MRVGINTLACAPDRSGGDATYVRELVRHLPTIDPDGTYVLFVAPWNRDWFPQAGRNLEHMVCPVPAGSFVVRALWEQLVLPRYVQKARLHVLHAPVNVAPLAAECPTLLTLHEAEPFMPGSRMPPPLRVYWRTLRTASARRAARILAVSRAAAEELVRFMHVSSSKLGVVYHGVDTRRFRPPVDGHREHFILWVGRSYPRKNLLHLVEAYALLPASIRASHPLVMLGVEGWGSARVHERVQALGLDGCIRFLGRVSDDELPRWYRRARLFVFPSLHEAFGLPVLEALASATPVVCSDLAALREVAGDAAEFANPYSAPELANRIHASLRDPSSLERAAHAGPRRARLFSWTATASATRREYARAARPTA
jgi:glycosyltransferase involved in cell wall biosynthesis